MLYFLFTIALFIGGFWLYARAKRVIYAQASRNYVHDAFVVVDVETTGLDPDTDNIIEIGAVRFERGVVEHKETGSFSALIKINGQIPPEAHKVHGITDAMLQSDGIPIETALNQLKDFISDLPVIAYNAPFDQDFINSEARRAGMKPIIKRPICALKLARYAYRLRSHKLSDVLNHIGHSSRGLHRSLADCHAACAVYLDAAPKVRSRYRGA